MAAIRRATRRRTGTRDGVLVALIVLGAATVLLGCSSAAPATATVTASTATPPSSMAAPSPTNAHSSSPTPTPTLPPSPTPEASDRGTGPESTTEVASVAPAGAITIEMFGPPPRFRPKAITMPAGELVFYLQNDSPDVPHGVHTLAIGSEVGTPIVVSDEVAGGRRAVFTVRGLAAGEYLTWCTFPDHAGLGQTGTLTVE